MLSESTHTIKANLKKHVGLLITQTLVLLIIALIHIGFEIRALTLEHSVPKFATIDAESEVLGTSDSVESESNNANLQENIIQNSDSVEQSIIIVTPTPMPQPAKTDYIIAVYGDSMEDTMGERLEYLDRELTARYPNTEFHLYNYGIGSQNVQDGLDRWDKPLAYQDRNYRAITDVKPDIIIIGSFAYNVFTPHDRNNHWITLTRLVQSAQKLTPHVYMLAEIAPKRRGFGFGPNGVNWEPSTAYEHTGKIVEQLENAIGLSRTLNVPLIDAYTPSLIPGHQEGEAKYINPSDNIHPSVEGHTFIATQIVDTIDFSQIK